VWKTNDLRDPDPDVAVFLPSLAGGGAELVAVRLCREFASAGLDVDLVIGTAAGPRLQEVPDSVNLVDLEAKRFRFVLPRLIQYLRRRQPPVVLSFLVQANLMAIVARLLTRIPARLVVSERLHASAAVSTPDKKWFRFMPIFIRLLYRNADAVIAVSEGVATDLVEKVGLPRDLVVAIPNPVPRREITERSREPVNHLWFVDGHDVPVVLSVGRLVPSKDFPTLFRAVALLGQRCRLQILGEGPERERLADLGKNLGIEFEMPGYVENPYAWMARADVIALSSKVEGFPNVLVEGLALGKPVVATDCLSGPSEILDRGRFGFLVPVGEPEAFAKGLAKALNHPLNPRVLHRRTEEWSLASIADRYLDVLLPGD